MDPESHMPNPPETPPSSDIEGVNRDMRIGTPSKEPKPEPGSALDHAEEESRARPDREAQASRTPDASD